MEILATLGPATLNKSSIERLTDLGVTLFRINLSHTKYEVLADVINTIRSATDVPVCLDTEGAQVRTGDLKEASYYVKEHQEVVFCRDVVVGDQSRMNFAPCNVIDSLEVGDLISIDFNAVLVQVTRKESDQITCRVINEGKVGRNKAVSILDKRIDLSPLSERDIKCLALGREMGIKDVALSFANYAEDVAEIRKHCSEGTRIISKIECINALENLEDITRASDAILIDRGDLSREVEIESIPYWQKHIIATAKTLDRKVYVATNLLESMISEPGPTRAEVNDIYNTLSDGVNGLVLAAETAIGRFPLQCVEMVKKVIRTFEKKERGESISVFDINDAVPPHGGKLINLMATKEEASEAASLKALAVSDFDLMDVEQMAVGTYSPVRGFMSQQELASVLDDMKLPSGDIWTMPIILQVSEEQTKTFNVGEKISLKSEAGLIHGTLHINDIYELEKESLCQKWFGTTDTGHPGVQRIMALGNFALGGEVRLIKKQDKYKSDFYFTPSQTRVLFRKRGWGRVVGFHSRNVIHRAHEFIQLRALEMANADGLYISPVVGPKKTGDFLVDPIMESYQMMNDQEYYPPGKTVLGSFLTYSRYCGPREAIFTALCRKNMGCSHFIIGRDHTGVGSFYGRDDNKNIFAKLGDLGIEPIFFDEVAYCKDNDRYEVVDSNKDYERLSGTQVRETLSRGDSLPSWFIRQDIQDMLIGKIKNGEDLFWS